MSSPLRRHFKHFDGSIKNLLYRLYPQGVSSPQLIDSYGTRLTDDDYCNNENNNNINFNKIVLNNQSLLINNYKNEYCKNNGHCFSTNNGPKCDCSFTDYNGKLCDKSNNQNLCIIVK